MVMRGEILLLLIGFFCFVGLLNGQLCSFNASFDWSITTAVSKTITTLQVVANPLLNPVQSPVAQKAFSNLAALGADYVRYVPWFPYPKVGVAELEPPTRGETSWDFTDIEPQFRLFMENTYGKGHLVIPNFSTQPTWMYGTNNWSYPEDPVKVDWDYPQGSLIDTSTKLVAEYYGRLLSWMVKGEFEDEYGVTHVNTGDKYNLTHWEVFNEPEGCHGLDVVAYTKQYDAIVEEIRRVVDPDHNIKFVGLALTFRNYEWIKYFLNPENHNPAALPIDYISYHFYASSNNRTDPDSYEQFFSSADEFFIEAETIAGIRDSISPHTKIDCDELGIILSNDNDAKAPDPPRIYWNAAAAFFAYLYGNMAPMGYDILGESQFAGVPVIQQWDIQDSQFPSVSMLNWTTGEGNARYWVLKLLLEHFQPGDLFVKTEKPTPPPTIEFCGDLFNSDGIVTLKCQDPNASINNILFAAYGLPTGSCDSGLAHNPKCDAANTTEIVKTKCLGRNMCSVTAYPTFGDPCFDQVKRLVIKATCSGTQGGYGFPSDIITPFVQGIVDVKTKDKKILVINKSNQPVCCTIPGSQGRFIYILDQQSGDGPARKTTVQSDTITLDNFAVAIISSF